MAVRLLTGTIGSVEAVLWAGKNSAPKPSKTASQDRGFELSRGRGCEGSEGEWIGQTVLTIAG
jgi:hypothetical protein